MARSSSRLAEAEGGGSALVIGKMRVELLLEEAASRRFPQGREPVPCR